MRPIVGDVHLECEVERKNVHQWCNEEENESGERF